VIRKSLVVSTLCFLPLASGCGHAASPESPVALAKSDCEGDFGSKALNSAPGTVEDVRTLEIGPGSRPVPHAFAGAPRKDTIAWCWTKKGTTYNLYAVAAAYKPVRVEGLGNAIHTPAPGPAAIP
jgi:hypothetical protein